MSDPLQPHQFIPPKLVVQTLPNGVVKAIQAPTTRCQVSGCGQLRSHWTHVAYESRSKPLFPRRRANGLLRDHVPRGELNGPDE